MRPRYSPHGPLIVRLQNVYSVPRLRSQPTMPAPIKSRTGSDRGQESMPLTHAASFTNSGPTVPCSGPMQTATRFVSGQGQRAP